VEGGKAPAPEYAGIRAHDIARSVIVDWNDLAAVERALAGGEIAVVIAEPILSNSGLILPEPGFHEGLRRLSRAAGTLLLIDEVTGEATLEPATGGTLWGNALSMAALRAALEHLWTPSTHEAMEGLAAGLASGMRAAARAHDRAWDVYHVGNRAGYRFAARPPRNNREAAAFDIPAVRHLQRVYLANRGVWDFGWWCGPAVSAQTTSADVDAYVAAFQQLLDELLAR
jgi:glutamate-1-semialdehyde 2,1-aminomutase